MTEEIKQERVSHKPPEKGEKPSALRVLKPKIDLNVCKKNYNCVTFCPRNAIAVSPKGWPVINYDLCDGCLICLRECPTTAITDERETTLLK